MRVTIVHLFAGGDWHALHCFLHSANRLPRNPADRPVVQTDDDSEQSHTDGTNPVRGAAGGAAMSGKTAREDKTPPNSMSNRAQLAHRWPT